MFHIHGQEFKGDYGAKHLLSTIDTREKNFKEAKIYIDRIARENDPN